MNKYRGVVYRALQDQPLNNFMLANHKAPFNDSLFRFKVKARNQALMTPFMRRLLFRKGEGICRICNKDRQNTIYHMLNACGKMTRLYTQRHDAVVDRLEEAINMLIKPSGEILRTK
jgi:hypothetical protein